MTAAPALPPDIPCVQKDASLHPRSFFFSSHVLCTASLKRPVQPPFPPRGKPVWGPWVPRSPSCDSSDAERGGLAVAPGSLPLWGFCSLLAAALVIPLFSWSCFAAARRGREAVE